jgi:hypothetical protein
MIIPMKAKPTSPEYKAFEGFLGTVLKVSKTELDARIKAEKRTPKSASPASAVPTKPA